VKKNNAKKFLCFYPPPSITPFKTNVAAKYFEEEKKFESEENLLGDCVFTPSKLYFEDKKIDLKRANKTPFEISLWSIKPVYFRFPISPLRFDPKRNERKKTIKKRGKNHTQNPILYW